MKLHLLPVIVCCFTSFCHAQSQSEQYDNLSKLHWDLKYPILLTAGKFTETPVFSSEIHIDSSYYTLMDNGSIMVTLENTVKNSPEDHKQVQSTEFDNSGLKKNERNAPVVLTPNYWKKSGAKRVFLVGNGKLSGRTKWLDTDLTKGRITRPEDFKNLRVFNYEKTYLQFGEGHSDAFNFLDPYPGDPFLWNSLAECRKLSALSLHFETNHTVVSSKNIYMLDEGLEAVLESNELRSLHVLGLPFLPVNFHRFERLDHIIVAGSTPELLNLLLVMKHFQKEKDLTFGGQFYEGSEYLLAVDTSQLIIPENGIYRSFYSNGGVLCEGKYTDGKPDGKWTFLFPNGIVCQERYYIAGDKTGHWIFRNFDGDTVAEFKYTGNRLTYRLDVQKEKDQTCDNPEFTYALRTETEYFLQWKSDTDVQIDKTSRSVVKDIYYGVNNHNGEVLKSHEITLIFKNDRWSLKRKDSCIDGSYQLYSSHGLLGSPPLEAALEYWESIDGSKTNFYVTKYFIDVKRAFREKERYSRKGTVIENHYKEKKEF